MELGGFSISLTVKDIAVSRAFYEKLGFSVFGGDAEKGWLVMKQGNTLVGLYKGMFEKNMLTFNPGWDSDAKPLPSFTDVREIQRHLKAEGINVSQTVDESTKGPGHIMIEDPDGNPILIDQHV